jgi:lipopolysaccharide export system permease protein
MPFVKKATKKYTLNIDLSQLNKVNVDDENIANTNTMLTINELGYTLDSLHKNLKTEIVSYSENINLRTGITNNNIIPKTDLEKRKHFPLTFYPCIRITKVRNLKIANSNTVSTGYSIDATKVNLENKQKNINNHQLAFSINL